jgi:hypothetical protein
MSLLDNASLVLTPNAYKEGKLYSVIPSDGSGDFTFTRATSATRVNAEGLIETASIHYDTELIVNGDFATDSDWAKGTGWTISGGKANCDGSQTSTSSLYQNAGLTIGAAYKVIVTISNYSAGNIRILMGGSTFGEWVNSNGEKTFILVQSFDQRIYVQADANFVGSIDNVSVKEVITLNVPRIDYSLGGCPNILLEPQRTNLALQSSSFDSAAWTKVNATVTANTTTSPSGIVDADTLTADGTSNIHQTVSSAISFTNSTTYTYSVYVKKNTNNFIQLYFSASIGGMFANFDLNSGSVGTLGTLSGSAPTSSIVNVGNGWYRCSMTITANATTTAACVIHITSSSTAPRAESNTLSTSVYIWGAQVEAGSYATSYIPTTTASVTRNADIISKPNLGTYMSPQNNTIFFDFTTISGGQNTNIFRFNTSSGNTIQFWYFLITNSINIQLGGVFYNTGILSGKVAIQINPTDTKMFVNGVLSATAGTTGVVTTLTSPMDIYSNGATMNCKTMQVYNTSLSDAECIALTTL